MLEHASVRAQRDERIDLRRAAGREVASEQRDAGEEDGDHPVGEGVGGADADEEVLEVARDEEGSADKKLTSIAEGGLFRKGVNERAISSD